MIEFLVLGGSAVATIGGFFVGRLTTDGDKPEPQKDFICPYCTNVVTGFKELDLIHHVSCIGKSEADLAAEAKKAKAKVDDEYYVTLNRQTYSRIPLNAPFSYSDCALSGGDWSIIEGTLYRNGEVIFKTYKARKADAENECSQHVELDKHKRRTAKRR